MKASAPFSVAHEASVQGVRWAVINSKGECVAAFLTKREAFERIEELKSAASRIRKRAKTEKKTAIIRPARTPRARRAAVASHSKNKYRLEGFGKWIGRRIRARRKELGMTMVQLCEKAAGCSRAYLDKVEHGESSPSIGMLRTLAHSLKWTLSELIAEEDVTDELERLRAIERKCILHLDDCALEKVTGRPWQDFRT